MKRMSAGTGRGARTVPGREKRGRSGAVSKRRFSNVQVLTEVRCMSDGHYWFRVTMDGGPVRSYQPECGFEAVAKAWQFTWEAPKYLIAETDRLIAKGCREGRFKVYECDRDGWKRYEDLRYHDPAMFAWYAEHLGQPPGAGRGAYRATSNRRLM